MLVLVAVLPGPVTAVDLDPSVEPEPLAAGGTVPAPGDRWQWQLLVTGKRPFNSSYDARAYDVDMEDTPTATISALKTAGRYVVCYFSAGTFEPFRDDAHRFNRSDKGKRFDPPFGNERWIDIRSDAVHDIMLARLDVAADKGCDAVEPDNVDAWDNRNGLGISQIEQIAYNKFIANEAHQRGLAVGLKNDLAQIPELVRYFDFAVNEQCFQFEECDLLRPFLDAGKPVFNAEYARRFRRNKNGARDAICDEAVRAGIHTLVLPITLNDAFRCSCDDGDEGQKECPE